MNFHRTFARRVFQFVFAILSIAFGSVQADTLERPKLNCRLVDSAEWGAFSESIKGKELVAFASWCSSCREKLMGTKASPESYIFVSVYEEPEQSARVINRLGLKSSCVHGPDLAKILRINALPWSRKF